MTLILTKASQFILDFNLDKEIILNIRRDLLIIGWDLRKFSEDIYNLIF